MTRNLLISHNAERSVRRITNNSSVTGVFPFGILHLISQRENRRPTAADNGINIHSRSEVFDEARTLIKYLKSTTYLSEAVVSFTCFLNLFYQELTPGLHECLRTSTIRRQATTIIYAHLKSRLSTSD